MTAKNLTLADTTCIDIMNYIVDVSGQVSQTDSGVLSYDARIFGYDWNPNE